MRVAVLTSSRADYSQYYPLLTRLAKDDFFDLTIIAFGTHLSEKYGRTVKHIYEDGFSKVIEVATMTEGDGPADISASMSKTIAAFAAVWQSNDFDLVFSFGDRYEMFAAAAASVPFGVKVAHIHGGETTMGAMDDIFRHCITHIAKLHFPTTEIYRRRVVQLKGSDRNVFNVGALSMDNLYSLQLLSPEEFKKRFGIDLSIPSILVTFHPETIAAENNVVYVRELVAALESVQDYQLIITMPNADTFGEMIRNELIALIGRKENAIGIESFGTIGYLTCMAHCSMMLGNTSSGFLEAAYFPKYVINLGRRQDGRIVTENIRNCAIERHEITDAIEQYKHIMLPASVNIYGDGTAAEKVVSMLKTLTVGEL